MSVLSNRLIKHWLDSVFSKTDYINVGGGNLASVFVAAMQTLPDADGVGGVELAAINAYARVSVTNNSTNFPVAALGDNRKANGAAITFPTVTTAPWAAINGLAVYETPSANNVLLFAVDRPETSLLVGESLSLPVGTLVLRLANELAASGASNILIKHWLDSVLGLSGALAINANLTVKLMRTLPNVNGVGGVALTGSGYADVTVGNNATNWPLSILGTGEKVNGIDVTFPAATADWLPIAGVSIYSGSDVLCSIARPESVTAGQQLTFPAGSLKISIK